MNNNTLAKSKKCKRKTGPSQFVFPPGVPYQTICKPPKIIPPDYFHQFFLTHSHFQFGDEDKKFQLARHLNPVHYTLCIKPNLESLEFEGCVGIRCEIPRETASITLHAAAALTITKAYWLEDTTTLRHESVELTMIAAEQRLNITFEPPIPPHTGVLVMNFNGHLNEFRSAGFYASKYTDEFGEKHSNHITKFLPAQARKCFPCFDEPLYKSTFGLSFVVPKTAAVVSNMPGKLVYPHRTNKDLHVVEFENTPKMSTYLLAFAIGHFSFIENRIKPNLPCRIYANWIPRKREKKFAFDLVSKFVSYFEEYLGIPFPIKKFDIIMEKTNRASIIANEYWGLAIFSAGHIFEEDDNLEMDEEYRISVMSTFAHVIFKQWFGNLVTPKWWTHMWLFESMARLMEYNSIDSIDSTFDIWMRFVTTHYIKALGMDALRSTHIIEVNIGHAFELKEVFDSMAYSKGAAILRMLQAYIGPLKFQEGLNLFLKQNSYSNASTDDFWTLLEEITGKPITTMMMSWTKEVGFPLIRIVSARYENNCRVITLHQDIFCADSSAITRKFNALWVIPITISFGSKPKEVAKEVLMTKRSISFKLCRIEQNDWFKLNPGLTGFYRVKYPIEMFVKFRQAIRLKILPPIDRLGMLCDAFALAESGISSVTEMFSILEAFEDEDNLSVWMQVDSIIHDLDVLLHTHECYHNFRNFVKAIYKQAYVKLGWESSGNENYKDKILRKLIITRLFICDHEGCQEEGRHKFEQLLLGNQFSSQILPLIYKAGMTVGDKSTFETLIRRFRIAEDGQDRADILESMGFCKNEVILREMLEFSVSEEVHHEDTVLVFKSFASNIIGRSVVWEFFKERYTILVHRYPPGGEVISQLLQAVIECYSTEEKLIEISDFFRTHQNFRGCERIISQSLEKIHNCAVWFNRDRIVISDYLAQFEFLNG